MSYKLDLDVYKQTQKYISSLYLWEMGDYHKFSLQNNQSSSHIIAFISRTLCRYFKQSYNNMK